MSRVMHRNPVYNGFLLDPAAGVTLLSGTPSGYVSIPGPRVMARWCEDITWSIAVEAVTGAPTSATLKARFQTLHAFWGGPPNGQDLLPVTKEPIWTDMTADGYPGLVDQHWPAQLADELLGSAPAQPLITLARIKGGFVHRVVFDLAVSGGTSPKFQISADLVMKG